MTKVKCNEFPESSFEAIELPVEMLNGISFEEAYRSGLRNTVRTLQSIGASLDHAEEIAQEAWVKGWEFRVQLRNPDALTAWIATIARNLYRSWIAKEKRFDGLQEYAVPSHLVRDSEAKDVLSACSSTEAKMLQLYYLEGYTAQEISKAENLCPTTIRVRLLRIRRTLRMRVAPLRAMAA